MLYISIDERSTWDLKQTTKFNLISFSTFNWPKICRCCEGSQLSQGKDFIVSYWRSQLTSPLLWLMPWLGCNSYSLFPIPLKTLFVPACEGRSPYDDRLVVITYATPITTNWGRVKEELPCKSTLVNREAPFWKVPCLFGHCPNSFWPPNLWDTFFRPYIAVLVFLSFFCISVSLGKLSKTF